MHDLDRTLNEFEAGIDALESGEYEYEGEWSPEIYGEVLGEANEVQLAAELLEVASEQELEQFLGSLVRKAAGAAGNLIRSPVGQALGGILKDAAGKALPVVGGAIGNAIAPGSGQQIGQRVGNMARAALGWELGEMSQEQEFETARSLVRVAAAAAQNLAQSPAPRGGSPVAAAKQAAIAAAQQHAPELLRVVASSGPRVTGGAAGGGSSAGGGQSGTWVRRGSTIVLYGA